MEGIREGGRCGWIKNSLICIILILKKVDKVRGWGRTKCIRFFVVKGGGGKIALPLRILAMVLI